MFRLIVTDKLARVLFDRHIAGSATVGTASDNTVVLPESRLGKAKLTFSYRPGAVVLDASGAGRLLHVAGQAVGHAASGHRALQPHDDVRLGDYLLRASAPTLPDVAPFTLEEPAADAAIDPERLIRAVDTGELPAAAALYRTGRRAERVDWCLRALCLAPPSPLVWQCLTFCLDQLAHPSSDWPLDQAVAYAEARLTEWPEALCVPPSWWWGNAAHGADEPRMRLARVLSLPPGQLTAGEAATLFEASSLSTLTRLAVRGEGKAVAGVLDALLDTPGLAGLRALAIEHIPLAATQWGRLLESDLWSHLDELALVAVGLDDEWLRALLRAPMLGNLRVLDLRANHIGERGVRTMASAPHLGRLERLDLSDNPIPHAAYQLLRQSVRIPQGALVFRPPLARHGATTPGRWRLP